ncbi:MAG TPA: FAD-binding protein [Actinomycetales bacterium]|jgi:xylitol oxidase
MPQLTNWAGNVEFAAARLHRPTTLDELQEVVRASERLRVLGTGHSFNRIADTTGDLVSVADLPTRVDVDEPGRTVTVSAGTRYAEVTAALQDAGLALHNLGSLPHISVGGACATGTHGSGSRNGVLATAVRGLELVGADGELRRIGPDDPQLAGSVISLGALGVVTALTLAVEPTYEVQQVVYDDVAHSEVLGGVTDILDSHYSLSLFSTWREPLLWQTWVKHRVDDEPWAPPATLFGAHCADGLRHPVPGVDPVHCTDQSGDPGPWNERLPTFRREFTPSSGEELQSEFMVPRHLAREAIAAVTELAPLIAPVIHCGELRSMAADDLWMSPAQGRETIAIHFTWKLDPERVAPVVARVQQALAPFEARPHWGKIFSTEPADVLRHYDRAPDFAALLKEHDPAGVLRGDFVGAYFPV